MEANRDIVVIGGGAAGIIAAWRAAFRGMSVTLLEKNDRIGLKILISGGGKCNITNNAPISEMLKQFNVREERFLRFAFHQFRNTDLLALLDQMGISTYATPAGKVFPTSNSAKSVVHAFESLLTRHNVKIQTNSVVISIQKSQNTFSIETKKGTIETANVIIASGGASYAKTGTTGDGYEWLKRFGHTIVPISPALAPIILAEPLPPLLQGTPIRDCGIMIVKAGRTVARSRGDLLITHFGLSGPGVLHVSHAAYNACKDGQEVDVAIDFFPELSDEEIEKLLLQLLTEHNTQQINTILSSQIPTKLVPLLLNSCSIHESTRASQLKKSGRIQLRFQLKHWKIGRILDIPLDRGEVTAGGVSLDEVEPKSMQSKLQAGMYICGEVLDIAGPIGGYNLQAAFSTGFVAGEAAAL